MPPNAATQLNNENLFLWAALKDAKVDVKFKVNNTKDWERIAALVSPMLEKPITGPGARMRWDRLADKMEKKFTAGDAGTGGTTKGSKGTTAGIAKPGTGKKAVSVPKSKKGTTLNSGATTEKAGKVKAEKGKEIIEDAGDDEEDDEESTDGEDVGTSKFVPMFPGLKK